MGVQTTYKLNPVLEILRLVPISLAGWILVGFLTVLTFIYRHLVDIVLRLKYLNKYGGLFEKSDSLYQGASCNITSVLFIKCQEQKDVLGHVRQLLQEKVFDDPNHYPKLTGSVGVLAGYPYWLKNEVNVDDVLKILELPEDKRDFDENYLNEAVAKISDQPINGTSLWSFYVSPVPLETKNKDGYFRYPIVGNFSHSIGDGTALVELFLKLFGDDSSQNYGESIFRKLFANSPEKTSNVTKLLNFLRKSCIWFEIIFMSLGRIIENIVSKLPDKHDLKPKVISGKKHVVWATETQPKAIGMIKHIKTKENTRFACVCITAIAASLTKYFKQNSLPVPKSLTVLFTLLTAVPQFRKSKPAVLDNKPSAGSANISTTLHSTNLKLALKSVTETMTVQVRYADILFFQMMLHWMGNLPLSWMKYFDVWKNETCFISNVPGGTRVQVLDGCVLETVVPVVPIFGAVGLSFGLTSYDGRLQIGVAVDQKLASKEQAQQIVDGILQNISLLYEECKG